MKALRITAAAIILVAVLGVAIKSELSSRSQAGYAKAQTQITQFQRALNRYYMDNGSYPTSDQGLQALVGYECQRGWWEGDPDMVVPRQAPAPDRQCWEDPWGRPYFYQSDGNTYTLKSFGPSGKYPDERLTAHSP